MGVQKKHACISNFDLNKYTHIYADLNQYSIPHIYADLFLLNVVVNQYSNPHINADLLLFFKLM